MRKFYIILSGLLMQVISLFAQTYLSPEEGYKVAGFLPDYTTIGAFDIKGNLVYIHDGDTIHEVDMTTGKELRKFGEPADYGPGNYASFLTVSPDGKSIWAGYTSDGNTDDRIYCIDLESGFWSLKANLPGNFDLIFWNDSLLVSGLNSTTWSDPNGIFILDTSGLNQHRLIIDVGGNSAGMAIDTLKNLYYGTSNSLDPNAIYRWYRADLEAVIGVPGTDPLQISDGFKMTDVPAGVSDCEIDEGFNLIFNMNLFGSPKVVAMWNGTWGDGYNLDTIAVASGEWDWMGSLKSMGDFTLPDIGERLLTYSFGKSLVDLHTADYPPVLTGTLPTFSGYEKEPVDSLDLTQFVSDPDEKDAFTFHMEGSSNPAVADLHINENYLVASLKESGQTNILIVAEVGEHFVEMKTVVGAWPRIEGDHLIANLEDLVIDNESYWNGSDGSGAFISSFSRFHNAYDPEWLSWSGWAYSNVTDNTTTGWQNQYSALSGEGFNGSENYGVGYATSPSVMSFKEDKAHAVEGFFVTNSTYAGLSMRDGDDFTKKFGGEEGTDPDFFSLDIWGTRDGNGTDTITYYLADFRSEDPFEDYIISTWQWVDLTPLGKVDSLQFALFSSDMGDWGMNTPGYFCMDNLFVIPDAPPYLASPVADTTILSDGSETVIDLSGVFSDPDDGDEAVLISILSNSNEEFLEASISGNELSLRGKIQLLKSVHEEAEIVIEGSSGGLKVTDAFKVTIEWPGDIELQSGADIRVYPNPSHGSFTIEVRTPGLLDVTILSITGSSVYRNPTFESGQSIDLSDLSAGPYIVRIGTEKGLVNKMIQKL